MNAPRETIAIPSGSEVVRGPGMSTAAMRRDAPPDDHSTHGFAGSSGPGRPRIEIEPVADNADPFPRVTFTDEREQSSTSGPRLSVAGGVCRFDPGDGTVTEVALNTWCEAVPGWRFRVVNAPAPLMVNAVWTAPELELIERRDGQEHHQRIAAPLAEGSQAIVGRDPECDILIEDAHVSRRQLRLFVRKGRLLAEDLRSQGGTMLNDRPLAAPSELSHGDTLVFGFSTLRYVCFWDVLTKPVRTGPRTHTRVSGDTSMIGLVLPPFPAPTRPAPRPIAEPPSPPSAWEQNIKISALVVVAICCIALITLLVRL